MLDIQEIDIMADNTNIDDFSNIKFVFRSIHWRCLMDSQHSEVDKIYS